MCIRDRCSVEKHCEFNKETHLAFIIFKKPFNCVDRKILLKVQGTHVPDIRRNLKHIVNTNIIHENNKNVQSKLIKMYYPE